jgi:hypothetical protein
MKTAVDLIVVRRRITERDTRMRHGPWSLENKNSLRFPRGGRAARASFSEEGRKYFSNEKKRRRASSVRLQGAFAADRP